MTWILNIRKLLGKFWTFIFSNSDFIQSIEYILVSIANTINAKYLHWIACKITPEKGDDDGNGIRNTLPFAILIDYDSIRKQTSSVEDILNGATIGAEVEDGGWVAMSKTVVPTPLYIQDHLFHYSNLLINGCDFEYNNGYFLFYSNPHTMNLPIVKIVDEDNKLKLYYRLFGLAHKSVPVNELISTFISKDLVKGKDAAWDMYCNGATIYNVKKLLASNTESVVCSANGTVNSIWKEHDTWCVLVDNKLYTSKSSPNVSVGDVVKAGTILAGDLKIYTDTDNPTAADIPGIKVRVDAGEVVAYNAEQSAIQYKGVNILPVAGDASVISSYKERCYELATATSCPVITVPDRVNPYQFIMNKLRRGGAVAITLTAYSLTSLAAAIRCIRKCSIASSMINIYIKAETDTHNLTTASFTATAGMGAVATVVSVGIKGSYAEAKILR